MKKILHLCFVIFFGILAIFPLQVFAVADAFEGSAYPNVCVGAPIEREEIGGTRFPVAPKYKHLNWLGQLFTADDCGEERLGNFLEAKTRPIHWDPFCALKKAPKMTSSFAVHLKFLGSAAMKATKRAAYTGILVTLCQCIKYYSSNRTPKKCSRMIACTVAKAIPKSVPQPAPQIPWPPCARIFWDLR